MAWLKLILGEKQKKAFIKSLRNVPRNTCKKKAYE